MSVSHILKGKSTTFYVDVQSMFMVIVNNWSNKFLSLCCIDRGSWVFWVVLLTQPFLQCLHVPGCIASKKNKQTVLSRSSRLLPEHFFNVIFVVFNNNRILVRQNQKISSKQTWCSLTKECKGKDEGINSLSFFLEPLTLLVPGRTRDFEAAYQRHREQWKKYCWVSHYIPISDRERYGWKSAELTFKVEM